MKEELGKIEPSTEISAEIVHFSHHMLPLGKSNKKLKIFSQNKSRIVYCLAIDNTAYTCMAWKSALNRTEARPGVSHI